MLRLLTMLSAATRQRKEDDQEPRKAAGQSLRPKAPASHFDQWLSFRAISAHTPSLGLIYMVPQLL